MVDTESSSDAEANIIALDDIQGIWNDENSSIQYLIDKGVFRKELACGICNSSMIFQSQTFSFRCRKKNTERVKV